jgi:hypothetical protein
VQDNPAQGLLHLNIMAFKDFKFGSVIGSYGVPLTKYDADHFYYGSYLVDIPLLEHEMLKLNKQDKVEGLKISEKILISNGGAGIAHHGYPSISNLKRVARELHEGKEPEGPSVQCSLQNLRDCGLKISEDTIKHGK